MRIFNSGAVFVFAAACLSGCTVGPDYHAPHVETPSAFTPPATQPATARSMQAVDLSAWWQSFNDPELDSLIDRAVAANLDLEIALTRLQEARAFEGAVIGGALPLVDFSGGAGGGSGTNSTKGRVAPPLNAGSNTTGLKEITQVVGFDAGWELDLWGRYRREIEAAGDQTQAMLDQRNAVLITVVADVARAYMDYRGLQERLAIARDNIQIEQQTVNLVQERFNRGLTNELDLALAKRQLQTLQSALPPLRADLVVAERRIAVLLGKYPGDIGPELAGYAAMPAVPAEIAPGLPLDLLRRRPDILESERELAEGTARVGVAVAQLFPRVAITAGVGMQGQGLGVTPATNAFLWSVGPTAYWPLLDFGTLDATIEVQNLRAHESLVNYKRTILNAVVEVENAISNYDAQQQRLADLGEAARGQPPRRRAGPEAI